MKIKQEKNTHHKWNTCQTETEIQGTWKGSMTWKNERKRNWSDARKWFQLENESSSRNRVDAKRITLKVDGWDWNSLMELELLIKQRK